MALCEISDVEGIDKAFEISRLSCRKDSLSVQKNCFVKAFCKACLIRSGGFQASLMAMRA